MASLRATQFFDGVITGPGPVNLYTVPTGFRIILRSINMFNPESTTNPCTVALAGGATLFALTMPIAGTPGSTANLQPWVVVSAGQVLQGYTGSGKHCHIVLSGSLLYV